MEKILRTAEDITRKFHEQVSLLLLACENYDGGQELAAYNIATTIRVITHDTPSNGKRKGSTSALTHVQQKNMLYLDTVRDNINPLRTFTGLIHNEIIGVHDGKGGTVNYKPNLNGMGARLNEWVTFEEWWRRVVFQNPDGSSLTRGLLVLKAANQEGGAHIDAEVDTQYDKFRHHYSGGVFLTGNISGSKRSFDNVPVLPAIRQVGYELVESLKRAGISGTRRP